VDFLSKYDFSLNSTNPSVYWRLNGLIKFKKGAKLLEKVNL